MAYSETATIVSRPSATTFSTGDRYKFFVNNSLSSQGTVGHVILPNTTGNTLPLGTLYGVTSTTNVGQAVPVAIGGIVKVQMAASTLSAGSYVASSTAGLGIAPTTDSYVAGQIVSGSSGAAGRIVSVQLFTGPLFTGPLSTP